MNLMPALGMGRWALAFPALLLALVACGDSESPNPAPVQQQRPDIQRAIDELEASVGFRPVAPTYLPDGMDSTPETAFSRTETEQTAIIAFFPQEDNQAQPPPPAVLEITEDPAAGRTCPLCPGGDLKEFDLKGEPALVEEGAIVEENLVYYVLYFIAGDVLVTLNAEWNAPQGSGLTSPTDEMKQQLVRVAESMLAQT